LLMEMSVNWNSVPTALNLLAKIQNQSINLSDTLIKSIIKLLWRFGKREDAKGIVGWVKDTYPPKFWRVIEAFLAEENMQQLAEK